METHKNGTKYNSTMGRSGFSWRSMWLVKTITKYFNYKVNIILLIIYIWVLGKIGEKDAKTKFKNLKDTFRRILCEETEENTLLRKNLDHQWRFYDSMKFTRDYLLNAK